MLTPSSGELLQIDADDLSNPTNADAEFNTIPLFVFVIKCTSELGGRHSCDRL